jgi:hypothetical protein
VNNENIFDVLVKHYNQFGSILRVDGRRVEEVATDLIITLLTCTVKIIIENYQYFRIFQDTV